MRFGGVLVGALLLAACGGEEVDLLAGDSDAVVPETSVPATQPETSVPVTEVESSVPAVDETEPDVADEDSDIAVSEPDEAPIPTTTTTTETPVAVDDFTSEQAVELYDEYLAGVAVYVDAIHITRDSNLEQSQRLISLTDLDLVDGEAEALAVRFHECVVAAAGESQFSSIERGVAHFAQHRIDANTFVIESEFSVSVNSEGEAINDQAVVVTRNGVGPILGDDRSGGCKLPLSDRGQEVVRNAETQLGIREPAVPGQLAAAEAVDAYNQYIQVLSTYFDSLHITGDATVEQAEDVLASFAPGVLAGLGEDFVDEFHSCNVELAAETDTNPSAGFIYVDVAHIEQHRVDEQTFALEVRLATGAGVPEALEEAFVLVTTEGIGPTFADTELSACAIPRSAEEAELVAQVEQTLGLGQ